MKKAAQLVLELVWVSVAESLGLKKPIAELVERINGCKRKMEKALRQEHGLDAYLALCQLIAAERDKGFEETLTWLTAKKRASKRIQLVAAIDELSETLQALDKSLMPHRFEKRFEQPVDPEQVFLVDRGHGVSKLSLKQHKEADDSPSSSGISSLSERGAANFVAGDLSRRIGPKLGKALDAVLAAALTKS